MQDDPIFNKKNFIIFGNRVNELAAKVEKLQKIMGLDRVQVTQLSDDQMEALHAALLNNEDYYKAVSEMPIVKR